MNPDIEINKLTTATANIELIEKDLLIMTYHDIKGNIEETHAVENYNSAKSLCNSWNTHLLIVTAKGMLLSKEARHHVLIEFKNWNKIAVVVHTLGQKIMMNFLLNNFIGPPLKAFSNKENALKWLKNKK